MPTAAQHPVRILSLAAGLLLAPVCGRAAEPAEAQDQEPVASRLETHLRELADPRYAGRSGPGGKKAARYIADYLRGLKLKPAFDDGYLQAFGSQRDGELLEGANVAAVIPGGDPRLKDEYLVLGAHYDHLGVVKGKLYPGADDNASGVSMLLEAARVLASSPPKRSVLLVAFDLEEVGLLGSRHFVDHPPVPLEQIKFSITADMIGRSAADLTRQFVYVSGSEHAPAARDLVKAAQVEEALQTGFLSVDLIGDRSDFAPFRWKKIPFLFFSTGESGGYHSPSDTADRIEYEKLALTSRLIVRTVRTAADADALPTWQDEPEIGLEEVHTGHRVLTALLKDKQALPEGSITRTIAENTRGTLGLILQRGKITPQERLQLTTVCKLLLGVQ